MDITLIIAGVCALSAAIFMVAGALIHRSGVRQGLKMFRITWNAEQGYDPLDEPTPMKPADPDEKPEETV
jgi:hypothetical protein